MYYFFQSDRDSSIKKLIHKILIFMFKEKMESIGAREKNICLFKKLIDQNFLTKSNFLVIECINFLFGWLKESKKIY